MLKNLFLVCSVVAILTTGCGSKNVDKLPEASSTPKAVIGESIPNWVYENTSAMDEYYNILSASRNIIFFAYADCPIGRERKSLIEDVVSELSLEDKFQIYADLKPQGSVTVPFCNKLFEDISDDEVVEVAKERQGDTGRHAILKIEDDLYCIPPVKNGQLPAGACKCSVNYFLDNCSNSLCIINPVEKRIVKVPPTEEVFIKRLTELADNW